MIRWREFLMPYEVAVDELKNKFKAIRNEYRRNNEYSPIEFVVGRVKQIPSIIEKAQNLGLREDEVHKIDDIGGVRIICQFEDDIYAVAGMIRAREGMDLEIILEKDYIKEEKASGYRSYHMIVRYPVFTIRGVQLVLIEIQIRTMAMNFWATVEHSLRYKYKEALPEQIASKLKTSAQAVYSIDKEMQEIRDEIISAQALFMYKSNTVSQIINGISVLEEMGDYEAAARFRGGFDRINYERDPDNDEQLASLAKRIREAVKLKNKTGFEEMKDIK